jgi:hypothetical protein
MNLAENESIEQMKECANLTEIAGRTEIRVEKMEEEIRQYETDLAAKSKEDGDAMQIGTAMAALENAIKVSRARLVPVKAQWSRETEEMGKAGVRVGLVRQAVREYLDEFVRIRVAALHALCNPWQSSFTVTDHFWAIASDSEDFAPYNAILQHVSGSQPEHEARGDVLEKALQLLMNPLPAYGALTVKVQREWKKTESYGRIRDVRRHVTDECFKKHAVLTIYRPTPDPRNDPGF